MDDAALGIAGFFLILMLAEWLIVIVACVIVGKEKNRNGFLWGFFLNVIGLLVIAILPPLESKKTAVLTPKTFNQGGEKPRFKLHWFVVYFMVFFPGCILVFAIVGLIVDAVGIGMSGDFALILLWVFFIGSAYFAAKLSRK